MQGVTEIKTSPHPFAKKQYAVIKDPDPSRPSTPDRKALAYGALSFLCWGFFPIYWKLLNRIPAGQILAHRMVWSCLFYLAIFAYFSRKRGTPFNLFREPWQQWAKAAVAAAVLALNWWIFIYAVNTGQIIQGSLAYFINPLLNVGVGVIFFRERLPMSLKVAFAFAGAGVMVPIVFASTFPFIAISLALTFCAYGILKKTLKLSPDQSSAMEGLTGLVPALLIVIYYESYGNVEVLPSEWGLLLFSGVITGLPLILFAAAAQKLPYSLIGMMQFIAPTLQFMVGIFLYDEVLGATGLASFILIWSGIGIYVSFLLKSKAKSLSN